MNRVLTLSLSLIVALIGLSQTSCSKKAGQHIFLKLYTSCNLMGSLEPCG